MSKVGYVRFFEEFGIEDVPLVGGKNAWLGEMFQKLSDKGVRVPHGFAITANAYRYMLDPAGAPRHGRVLGPGRHRLDEPQS
jgi:pyruvate,water dikinase